MTRGKVLYNFCYNLFKKTRQQNKTILMTILALATTRIFSVRKFTVLNLACIFGALTGNSSVLKLSNSRSHNRGRRP